MALEQFSKMTISRFSGRPTCHGTDLSHDMWPAGKIPNRSFSENFRVCYLFDFGVFFRPHCSFLGPLFSEAMRFCLGGRVLRPHSHMRLGRPCQIWFDRRSCRPRVTGALNAHVCAPKVGPFGIPPCPCVLTRRSFGLAC